MENAAYYVGSVDAEGLALQGAAAYRLEFEAPPPSNPLAFWSIQVCCAALRRCGAEQCALLCRWLGCGAWRAALPQQLVPSLLGACPLPSGHPPTPFRSARPASAPAAPQVLDLSQVTYPYPDIFVDTAGYNYGEPCAAFRFVRVVLNARWPDLPRAACRPCAAWSMRMPGRLTAPPCPQPPPQHAPWAKHMG